MKRPIYLLSREAHSTNGYVSEGLISLPMYLKNARVVISEKVAKRMKLSDIPLINYNAVLSPRWVLSDHACKILTNFRYIRQGPVLTILNAFELVMKNVITSAADVATDRIKRCVALMCYTLIDTLLWKDNNYKELANTIKQKCDAFLKGETLSTLVTIGTYKSPPKIVGTFYEVILGMETMSRLGRIVSAEYKNLLKTVERNSHLLPKHTLEQIVEKEKGSVEDENMMTWVRLERHRRNHIRSADMMAMERLAPKGVNFLPTLNHNSLDTGALDDLYSALKVEGLTAEAIKQVFFGRQVSHVNFNVCYNPYFSFYTLWNWMFLATGALFNTPSNPITRNLLVNVIVKDMHVILLCPRCYDGFVAKKDETYHLAQTTKMKSSSKLKTYLRDIIYSFTGKEEENIKEENVLFKKIILLDGLEKPQKMINGMTNSEKKKYAFRAITASKGFAAIGLYSLLYSIKLQDLAESDVEVVTLLNDKSILYTIGNGDHSSETDKATIAFIGLWSLRNAIRLRRDVNDPTNYIASSFPSSPMSLSSILLQTRLFKNDSFLNLPYITNFKEEFVKIIDKYTLYMR